MGRERGEGGTGGCSKDKRNREGGREKNRQYRGKSKEERGVGCSLLLRIFPT